MTISSCLRRGARVGASTAMVIAAVAVSTLTGCTSVDQMYAAYQKGDESQYVRLIEIAGRHDIPYATRKTAVKALGEIGLNQALPVLLGILHEFDQRSSLKEETLVSLGRIGDPTAVPPIGHLLDRSLTEPNADLRMTAMPVLSQLGGADAAEILVNALMYYDVLMMRSEATTYRGVFSGDEQKITALRDSMLQSGGGRSSGLGSGGGFNALSGQAPTDIGFFGSGMDFVPEVLTDTTPKERDMAHESLVGVGAVAVPVIEDFLLNHDTTTTLQQELAVVIGRIQGVDVEVGADEG